jgi:uncharacterized protein YlzI (FlbEa/FlbD family)
MQLSLDINSRTNNEKIENACTLISKKAYTIKEKAQRMENRLHAYRGAIEDLGFKRVKDKRRK